MSDNAPKVDPKYYKASGTLPGLVPVALKAFRAMLWAGLTLALVGVVVVFSVTIDAGLSVLYLALPLIVGAGLVAGLGRRETN